VTQEKAPFSSLARVYDAIFVDVEYEDWADFALVTLSELGWLETDSALTLLDLACGTGNSAKPYMKRGFEVSGADFSSQMLALAKDKLPSLKLYQQGFLELDIPKRFQIITCVFDSLNNLLTLEDLEITLSRVKTHLVPNGVFVFDCNTPLGVTNLWEDDEFIGEVQLETGSAHYHWTHQAKGENLGEVTAHIWIMDDQGALEQEFHEIHLERGFTPSELETALNKAGFLETHFVEYPEGETVTDQTPRFWGFAR
jgi:SAM-dependent methyltransferase